MVGEGRVGVSEACSCDDHVSVAARASGGSSKLLPNGEGLKSE